MFSTPELMCTAGVVGWDNILVDRVKVAHKNAERVLKLAPSDQKASQ